MLRSIRNNRSLAVASESVPGPDRNRLLLQKLERGEIKMIIFFPTCCSELCYSRAGLLVELGHWNFCGKMDAWKQITNSSSYIFMVYPILII